jgi:hypothetical protein
MLIVYCNSLFLYFRFGCLLCPLKTFEKKQDLINHMTRDHGKQVLKITWGDKNHFHKMFLRKYGVAYEDRYQLSIGPGDALKPVRVGGLVPGGLVPGGLAMGNEGDLTLGGTLFGGDFEVVPISPASFSPDRAEMLDMEGQPDQGESQLGNDGQAAEDQAAVLPSTSVVSTAIIPASVLFPLIVSSLSGPPPLLNIGTSRRDVPPNITSSGQVDLGIPPSSVVTSGSAGIQTNPSDAGVTDQGINRFVGSQQQAEGMGWIQTVQTAPDSVQQSESILGQVPFSVNPRTLTNAPYAGGLGATSSRNRSSRASAAFGRAFDAGGRHPTLSDSQLQSLAVAVVISGGSLDAGRVSRLVGALSNVDSASLLPFIQAMNVHSRVSALWDELKEDPSRPL